jgi:DNA-binding CsgD family transcriptional regulator
MQRIKRLCREAGLSVDQIEVIMLMHGEGMSRSEIASTLGISETSVSNRRDTGLALLKEYCESRPEATAEANFFGLWKSVRLRRPGSGRPKTHGESTTRLYRVWASMKQRCNNPKAKDYKNYGGRGITVCDPWNKSFYTFKSDMGPCPDGFTLDRINNSLGYTPENCKWSTPMEQAQNRRPAQNPGRPRKHAISA